MVRPGSFGRSRHEQQREQTRDQVVATALRLFVERGYVAVRVEDIAAAAGVSRATFYKYFSEREEILAELFARLLGRDPAPAPAGDAADVVKRVTTLLVESALRMAGQELLARFVYSLPIRHAALLAEGTRPPVAETVERLLTEAAAAGAIRTDLPVALLTAHVTRSFEAAMRDWAEGRADDVADHVRQLVDLAFTGVAPRPAVRAATFRSGAGAGAGVAGRRTGARRH